jgi:hypothetical protein
MDSLIQLEMECTHAPRKVTNKAISQAKIMKKPAEDKKSEQKKAENMTKQSTQLIFPKRQNKQEEQ